MKLLQPLSDKALALAAEHDNVCRVISDCRNLMSDCTPRQCSNCKQHSSVEAMSVPPTINAPQAHGIVIRCPECGLQTTPQYWHVSEPSSAYAALYDAYEQWGFTKNGKAEQP